MLSTAKILKNYRMMSLDGEIGHVKDFLFDDRFWTVRYLVANTANWLTGRKVLISPIALKEIKRYEEQIAIELTRKQIEDSPDLNSEKPVSRQWEGDYYSYYGWPVYWGGPYSWGSYPYLMHVPLEPSGSTGEESEGWDPNLRSCEEVHGYHIQAGDGEIGHVSDFVIEDANWTIRYLVVDTQNWIPGRKVLLSPQWIDRIDWEESKVYLKLSRETVRNSPEYDEEALVTRTYEEELHGHYDKRGYWVDDLQHVK